MDAIKSQVLDVSSYDGLQIAQYNLITISIIIIINIMLQN